MKSIVLTPTELKEISSFVKELSKTYKTINVPSLTKRCEEYFYDIAEYEIKRLKGVELIDKKQVLSISCGLIHDIVKKDQSYIKENTWLSELLR